MFFQCLLIKWIVLGKPIPPKDNKKDKKPDPKKDDKKNKNAVVVNILINEIVYNSESTEEYNDPNHGKD